MNIYTYNQTKGSSTFCVTGEESTCVEIEPPSTYEVGTIIKYKVNDTTEKYFHVVSDNGDTLTLQQRENIVNQTAWYLESNTNTMGPITILAALEEATSTWTNVLDQTYTMGTTIFEDNAYTGCEHGTNTATELPICTQNRYTLEEKTVKARMITVQEAIVQGCTSKQATCPVWMYNYANGSITNGGTINDTDYGYWTMNASVGSPGYSWRINAAGRIDYNPNVTNLQHGARAIVMINK